MVILAVDHPRERLTELSQSLRETFPEAMVLEYEDEMLAFQYLFDNPVDAVFTEIYMKRLNGFDVARMIKQTQPGTKVFFLAQDDADERNARKACIDGYLIRPVTPEVLRATKTAVQHSVSKDAQRGLNGSRQVPLWT